MINLRHRRATGGQGLAEFAIVLPVFLFIVMILFDFGRVVYTQNAIAQGARAATRFAAVSAPQTDVAIRNRARSVPLGVDLPDSGITGESGQFYPPGYDPAIVVVQIEVAVPIITPFISMVVGGSITVQSRSQELVR